MNNRTKTADDLLKMFGINDQSHVRIDPKTNRKISGQTYMSECGKYRYLLTRVEDPDKQITKLKILVVIGLNPSTATEKQDDPTIRRCAGFARRLGYHSLCMLNIFPNRETDPITMKANPAPDNIIALNDSIIAGVCEESRDHLTEMSIACAWGTHGAFNDRGAAVVEMLRKEGHRLLCFGVTKHNHPKHPLYLPNDTELVDYDV